MVNNGKRVLDDLGKRVQILERDRARLVSVVSHMRQMIQVITALGTGLSSIACATSTPNRTARDGTSKSVMLYTSAEFPVPDLEALYNHVVSATKSP